MGAEAAGRGCSSRRSSTNVATDLQRQGPVGLHRRSTATPRRASASPPATIDNALYDAFGQRIISTIFTQSNQYRVILEADADAAALRSTSLNAIYLPSSTATGGQVPLSADRARSSSSRRRCRSIIWASSRRRRSRSTSRPGASLGAAVDAIQQAENGHRPAGEHHHHLRGRGARVPGVAAQRAAADPGRDRHRLHRAGRAVRELHPPDHHPLDAALGRRRRAAGADDHRRTTSTSSSIIGIILLIGIVKKNAIMMIDFALDAEREEGKPPREAIHQACAAALPPDPDDDDGGAARRAAADARHRHRLGAAPPARHRDRRRPAGQPAADAVHHAGDLPVLRPAGARVRRRRGAPATPAAERAAPDEPLARPSSAGRSRPRC